MMVAPARPARTRAVAASPATPAIKVAHAMLAKHLCAFMTERKKAVAGDVEAVHRMRVATRRLRAASRMLKELAPDDPVGTSSRELVWLGGAIGAVRDVDVLGQTLERRAERLDPDFVRALEPISKAVRHQRSVAQARLVTALDSERCRGLLERLNTVAPDPGLDPVTLGALAIRLARPAIRATLRASTGLDEQSPPQAFHRLRVRAKRQRYALEELRGVDGKPLRKMLTRLENIQEELGAYNDTMAAIAWLRGWAIERKDAQPITLMAIGALIHSLERRSRRLRARSLKVWRRSHMAELAGATIDELEQMAARSRRQTVKQPLVLTPVADAP